MDVLVFDGVCRLCSASVQFILQHEKQPGLRFASAQSPAGQALLAHFQLATDQLETVVLIENGRAYTYSTAVIRIAAHLRQPWPMLAKIAAVVPLFVRDYLYKQIARRRYRWFGQYATCMVPTPEVQQRFLDTEQNSMSMQEFNARY